MANVEHIQVIASFAQILATVLVAAAVVVQAERLKSAEMEVSVRDAYNTMNAIALSDSKTLETFDSIGRPTTSDNEETRRKRWCAFVWLVTLQGIYESDRRRLLNSRYAERTLNQQLEIILRDDLVFWLLLNRGFSPKFAEYCTKIRKRILPESPLFYSEEQALDGFHAM